LEWEEIIGLVFVSSRFVISWFSAGVRRTIRGEARLTKGRHFLCDGSLGQRSVLRAATGPV
jgi:hypothetical protein